MQMVAYRKTVAGAKAIQAKRALVEPPLKTMQQVHREEMEAIARDLEEKVSRAEAQIASYRRELAALDVPYRPTLALIEARICRALKLTRNDIRGARKNDQVVFARQAVMYWAARLTPLSFPKIGQLLGGRDHTTILHGRKKYVEKRAAQGRTLRPAR